MAYDLYVVTDEPLSGGRSHVEIADCALQGGADVIQLRDKQRSSRYITESAIAIRELTKKAGKLFIVNDRLDIALIAGADGVHLGQEDIPLLLARRITPRGFIIGISVGSLEEALIAFREGADYIALSPVFQTGSKSDAGPGHGLEMFSLIRSLVQIPLIAIGGINRDNVEEVLAAGADGVAVISAIVSCPDITLATNEMKSAILKTKVLTVM
ncbi:MAG: thiamine phosphate synthase [Methanospirillaceae archaeon]|nr:thiamine phosphate synthase [Methanospirillaceae archaeon]